jgi:hypothetical protein
MKRLMLAVLICGLVIAVTGCGGNGVGSSNNGNGSGSSDPVKQTVESYFNAYYDSQKRSSAVSMNGLLADNVNIQMNEAFRSIVIKGKELFTTWILNYGYRIKYQNVNITGDTAAVDLILNLDYRYESSPEIQSGLYNVNYRFTLKKDGEKWVITGIDSDLDEFKMFKDEVGGSCVASNTVASSAQADAIEKAKVRIINQFREVSQSIDRSGSFPDQPTPADSPNDTVTVNSIYHVYNNYNYSPSAAVAYARKYALGKAPNFYKVSVDCTNFVSQCVWAGYGGTPTAANVENRVRMTDVWYAGSGGGSYNWENVIMFFNYMVSSKTLGPQGYCSDSNPRKIDRISAASVKVGDVIQLWSSTEQKFCHSMIVSENSNNDWRMIKVCYHTTDFLDVNIIDRIGWNASIRVLTPLSSRPFEK